MKKLIIALFVLTLFACTQEPKVEYTVFSGKIENATSDKVLLEGQGMKKEIAISADGTFVDSMETATSGFYTFSMDRAKTDMYLKEGADLSVTLDATDFSGTMKYEGTGAIENNYLAAKTLNVTKMQGNYRNLFTLDEAAFKAKLEEIKSSNQTALKALEGADATFVKTEMANLKYDYFAPMTDYEGMRARVTKDEGFKASEDFLPAELKNIQYDNVPVYNSSSSYRNMAFGGILTPIFENLEDFSSMTPADLSSIEGIKIPELKEQIVGYLAKMALSPANPNLTELFNFFKSNTTDETLIADITANYEQLKDLMKGKPSPTFTAYENHKGGVTSLADLKGKYVYIDVWATWCGPCKREIPALKKVEKDFHNKNIAFVSTSIDVATAHDKWSDMVKDKELGGIQLIADKDWKSQFVQDYGIQGIPRFILVDPEGNIVTADAPRPSDPKLVKLLESLDI
ncbi:MAG: thiol-disulfide isomerase/thioredoxin [Saprospiraceae bacterium]|jgi:thiol-disulfide isomerase/thioredoxin